MSTPANTTEQHADGADHRNVSPNFITEIVDADLQAGRYPDVVTRFPPEPNGYLHIGHAKSICLNMGLALDYGGTANLRFDDTNPETEQPEYVESIRRDVEWLGFAPSNVRFASDYFERMYECAVQLIRDGEAYVDSVNEDEMRELRGTVTEPGRPSAYRDRSVRQNLELFERMRAGEFDEGEHVLRAKIDLSHPNMKLRDPVLYRILKAEHFNTGNRWQIYPLYDFAHPIEDFIEGVSHSLCTLEFENNRAIYDWLIERLRGKVGFPEAPRPYQYEFARLVLDYTVLSKRKLISLVDGGHVSGWDDPRMPTVSGMRRRGVTPDAIREFCRRIGVSKTNSRVDVSLLESAIRDDLNFRAPRVMAVARPLKVVLTNWDADRTEQLDVPYWPHDVPKEGSRRVPFGRELYIEQDDFMLEPVRGFHRLTPGGRVRLRYAYVIRCDDVVRAEDGQITELRCSVEHESLGQSAPGVKGIVHWVSAEHAVPCEVRLYDRLFTVPNPGEGDVPFTEQLNPQSLVVTQGYVEPSVAGDPDDTRYQFERLGYFWRDPKSGTAERPVFNRIVSLRDTFGAHAAGQESAQARRDRSREADAQKREAQKQQAPAPAVELTAEQQAEAQRLVALGASEMEAQVLAREERLHAYLTDAAQHASVADLTSWVVNDLGGVIRAGEARVSPAGLAGLIGLLKDGSITTRIAKDVLNDAQETGQDPVELVRERGLRQVSDTAELEALIDRVMQENPDKVDGYRGGRTGLLGFFTGQVMRATQGQANPQVLQDLLQRKLQG